MEIKITIETGDDTMRLTLDDRAVAEAAFAVQGEYLYDNPWGHFNEALSQVVADATEAIEDAAHRLYWRTYWTDAPEEQDSPKTVTVKTLDGGWREVKVAKDEMVAQCHEWSSLACNQWTSDGDDPRVQSVKARTAALEQQRREERGW